jgi:hypothetical protein
MPWENLLESSRNPLAPRWDDPLSAALTTSERARFVEVLRPRVEQGLRCARLATTVTAEKP